MRGISTCSCYCMQYLTYIDDKQAGPISALACAAHEPSSPYILGALVGIPMVVTFSYTAAIG